MSQKYLAGQSVHLARGKVLGGSSAINYLGWLRASEAEYDAWEKLGNPGWNWASLLPYFKMSENVTRPGEVDRFPGLDAKSSQFEAQFQGDQGSIQVADVTFYSDVTPRYVEAFNSLGVETIPDSVSTPSEADANCSTSAATLAYSTRPQRSTGRQVHDHTRRGTMLRRATTRTSWCSRVPRRQGFSSDRASRSRPKGLR